MDTSRPSNTIRGAAVAKGIDALGFAAADPFDNYAIRNSRRRDPQLSLPNAKTIIVAGIYIGGAVALLLLYFIKDGVADGGVLYGVNQSIHHVDMAVVVIPGAFGCLLTGLIYSTFSHWGFFKQTWLIVKWIVTIVAILFGTFFSRPVGNHHDGDIRGIPCSVLICHEWRYPELYREQFGLGTKVLFQSWYDGNLSKAEYQTQGREMGSLITGTVRGSAANNLLWISASNTSRKESCFASFVVRPDGRIVHQLKRNVAGVLITRINSREKFADPSGPWRQRARKGILHSGV